MTAKTMSIAPMLSRHLMEGYICILALKFMFGENCGE